MEQIQYYITKGIWESRAGVIWGPFSEIYGLGIVLFFLLSNKMHKATPIATFFTATISGSTFEYLARYFQETYFDSVTWDYSNRPFNIGGRTSLEYGICWGLLGLFFVKLVFPHVNRILEYIKGKPAFVVTWFLIIFMTFDLLISGLAVNRWNERLQGVPSNGYIDEFLDSHYGDDKLSTIYPHLKFIEQTPVSNS